jgi:GT2 family glycosyltransferase
VAARCPGVRVIRNERNVGFATAANQGAAATESPYVAFLNPDVVLTQPTLSHLAAVLDRRPDLGAAGPALLLPDGTPQPYSHGGDPTPGYLARRLAARLRGRALHAWSGSDVLETGWVAGTCLVARRRAFEEVGGFDERFFMYFEDVDLGRRMRAAGWSIAFVPTTAVVHLGGAVAPAEAVREYDRSLARLYRKRHGRVAAAGVAAALRAYRAGRAVTARPGHGGRARP